MDVQFIASIAVITPDPSVSRKLYVDALGLPLTASEDDDYLHSEDIVGSKHFGVWPLTQAAQACFGTPDWPADRPVPQASIEFEVADPDTVQVAADELKDRGYTLLHEARTEPWGQTVARLQSSEGAIIGLSYAYRDRPACGDGRSPLRRATYRSAERRMAAAPSSTTILPHQPP